MFPHGLKMDRMYSPTLGKRQIRKQTVSKCVGSSSPREDLLFLLADASCYNTLPLCDTVPVLVSLSLDHHVDTQCQYLKYTTENIN